MKLMAIVGSPRKNGNTEILIDRIIEGCKSTRDVDAEKIFIVDKKIEYCNGCLTCTFPPPGSGQCAIKDDMAEILDHMKQSDAFIFGSPNHMRTITAPLLNFLARMLPLLVFKGEFDEEGNRIGGDMSSKIGNKKVAMVVTQGENFFCSALVHQVLESNLNDFRLKSAGNIISMGNLEKGQVADSEDDLKKAFDLGANLAIMTCRA